MQHEALDVEALAKQQQQQQQQQQQAAAKAAAITIGADATSSDQYGVTGSTQRL
jgi:hypothetical protein